MYMLFSATIILINNHNDPICNFLDDFFHELKRLIWQVIHCCKTSVSMSKNHTSDWEEVRHHQSALTAHVVSKNHTSDWEEVRHPGKIIRLEEERGERSYLQQEGEDGCDQP